jgi:hypothetical protein
LVHNGYRFENLRGVSIAAAASCLRDTDTLRIVAVAMRRSLDGLGDSAARPQRGDAVLSRRPPVAARPALLRPAHRVGQHRLTVVRVERVDRPVTKRATATRQ